MIKSVVIKFRFCGLKLIEFNVLLFKVNVIKLWYNIELINIVVVS